MSNKRLQTHLNKNKKNNPVLDRKQVGNNVDNKMDQDFPGFPHGHSTENIINPTTASEKKIADVENKDGEK